MTDKLQEIVDAVYFAREVSDQVDRYFMGYSSDQKVAITCAVLEYLGRRELIAGSSQILKPQAE